MSGDAARTSACATIHLSKGRGCQMAERARGLGGQAKACPTRFLPDQADGSLQPPRRIGLAADGPKRRVGRGCIGSAECHPVLKVKRLEPDLDILPLGELEVLIHRRVDLAGMV